jgi:hypothetical protein
MLVPVGGLIVGGGLMVWIADLFQNSTLVVRSYGQAFGLIVGLLAAFAAGFSVQRIWPWTYGPGRIVWIAPVSFLLLFFLIDLVLLKSVSDVVAGYFYPRPGYEDLGVALFTWPTASCCLYSPGMFASHRRSARVNVGQHTRFT